jgi:hypothetical protein
MINKEKRDALIAKVVEIFEDTIVDRLDTMVVLAVMAPALAFLIAKAHPDDRPEQLHRVDELAGLIRELIEGSDPPATTLQ